MWNQLLSRNGIWLAIFLVLAYFLIFMHLGTHPLYVWDEALFANRAYHWAYFGKYFTNWSEVANCTLDYPNTKPPLVSLLQALSYKIFGYTNIALRLPIGFFGLGTCLILISLFNQVFRNLGLGISTALILLTTIGYNHPHVLRSGDQDAALVFFLMASLISIFMYVHSYKRNNLFLVLYFFATACAILTKSVMGLFMVPAVVCYLLLEKKLIETLLNPWFYKAFIMFLLLVFSFYGVMEMLKPGFLELVWDNEIGGRYKTAIGNHDEPWYYYLHRLGSHHLWPWLFFIPLGIFYTYKFGEIRLKKWVNLVLISSTSFLLIISISKTKLEWYASSIYPLAAILAGLGLWYLVMHLTLDGLKKITQTQAKKWSLVILAILLALPIAYQIDKNYKPKDYWEIMQYEHAIKNLRIDHPEIKKFRIITRNEWYPNIIFWANHFSYKNGYDIAIITNTDPLIEGELLLGMWQENFEDYEFEYVYGFEQVVLWKIGKPKGKINN